MQEIIILSDDEQCKALALDCGVITELEPRGGKDFPYRQHVTTAHGDHYVCICRHLNYPKPEDNGYAAVLIHKSVGHETAGIILREFISAGQSGPAFFSEFSTIKQEGN